MIDGVLTAVILAETALVLLAVAAGLRATVYFWRLVRLDALEQGHDLPRRWWTRWGRLLNGLPGTSRLLRWVALLVTVIELGGLYIGALTVVRLLDPDARFPWSPYVSGIVVIAIVSIPWVLMRRVESLRRQRERRPSA